MTSFREIESQNIFKEALKRVDEYIAKAGFAPREHYAQIHNFRKRNCSIEEFAKMYWHRNADNTMHSMHEHYYMNEDGASIHFSAKLANGIDERNVIHFGSDSAEVSKQFKSFITKLRKLASNANADLQKAQDEYDDTPSGIYSNLSYKLRDLKDEIVYLVEGRRNGFNYRTIQKSSGSSKSTVFLEGPNDEVARVTYVDGSPSWKNTDAPKAPQLIAHFEDVQIQEQVNEMTAHLAELYEDYRVRVIEPWEKEQIIARLKGERVEEEPPF